MVVPKVESIDVEHGGEHGTPELGIREDSSIVAQTHENIASRQGHVEEAQVDIVDDGIQDQPAV
jgi:hypothetical protein